MNNIRANIYLENDVIQDVYLDFDNTNEHFLAFFPNDERDFTRVYPMAHIVCFDYWEEE